MGYKDGTALVRTKNPKRLVDPTAPLYNYRVVHSPGQRYISVSSDPKQGFEVIMEVLKGEPIAHDYTTAMILAKDIDDESTYYGVCKLEFDEYF